MHVLFVITAFIITDIRGNETTTERLSKIIRIVISKPETDSEIVLDDNDGNKISSEVTRIQHETDPNDYDNDAISKSGFDGDYSLEEFAETFKYEPEGAEKIQKKEQFLNDVNNIARSLNVLVNVDKIDVINDSTKKSDSRSDLNNRRSNFIQTKHNHDVNPGVVLFYSPILYCLTPQGHTRICEKYTNPGIYRSPHFFQKALLSPIKLPLRHHHHEPMLPINRIVLPSLTSKEYRRKLKDHTFDSVYGSNRHSNRICAVGQQNYPNPYDTVQC
ncbi:uncharacterized protein LOC105841439 [Bombyx mori]|uniref:Uncharacterized protein n=1 Tax=Bombyx mori TaxID=7091 RepID=A0A8R2G7I0_BOMMO|nr:uncharacterized protein LOC105841439 [Bombyx mori]